MMRRRFSLFLSLAVLAAPLSAQAQMAASPSASATPTPTPTAAPSPSASEAAFLAQVMRELPRLYPTAQSATAAGYFRYSNEDRTGAISYVNTKYWNSPDVTHPAQLWYDVNGKLLGADYSIRQADAGSAPPSLLGVSPSRLSKIGAHVHYVTCADASCTYGKAVGAAKYRAAGGDPEHPTAAGLVSAGAVKDAASVRTVFLYPAIYDVTVWVVPDPLGQFADANPNVKPSAHAGKGEDSD